MNLEQPTRRINVERVTVNSRKSFQDVLSKFDAAVGHPNIEEFWKHVAEAKTNLEWKSSFNWRLDLLDSWNLRGLIMGESSTKGKAAITRKFFDSLSAIR
jgi:hypothetical protein